MKVSVSIPNEDIAYLQTQIESGRYPTRSAAFHAAIKSLRSRDLEQQYAAAFDEWNESPDAKAWDTTIADGLDDEPW